MEEKMHLDEDLKKLLLEFQREEITEHYVYAKLARRAKGKNREVLKQISDEELGHFRTWKKYTQEDVKPNRFKIGFYSLLQRIFGLTFAVKLMEMGEVHAQEDYRKIVERFPETAGIVSDEDRHEKYLLNLIEEEKLNYVGSIVLGLNDALVELTGALAGLTFALGKSRLIALAGLITGIAASLSMMTSEYLSKKAENEANPMRASIYTGIAYIFTVLFLVVPYFLFASPYLALPVMLLIGIGIILLFTFFVSVTKDQPFGVRFLEMAAISLGVAFVSFGIGYVLNKWLGV